MEKLIADRAKPLQGLENHDKLVDERLSLIGEIENCYKKKDTIAKQGILSSIFAEKLFFDGKGYRTPKTLKVLSLISRIGEGSKRNKKGKTLRVVKSSLRVDFTNQISNSIIEELKILADLRKYLDA